MTAYGNQFYQREKSDFLSLIKIRENEDQLKKNQ